MVSSILKFLSKESKGVHQAAYLLAVFTLVSQFLGLIRDRLLAANFGASQSLDVYYGAFRIPDLIFVTVSSLVSVSVLVPFLIQLRERGRKEERSLIDSVFTVFFAGIIIIIALAYIYMPALMEISVPGIQSELMVPMARILLLSPLILGLSNLCGSLVQSRGRFVAYALSPVLYNLGIILGIIFLYPSFGLPGLAYGVVLGSLLHLFIQLPSLFYQKLLPRFTLSISWPLMKEIFGLSIPRTLTLASNHLVMLGLVACASLMAVGSISVFTFAFNLQSVPMGIIGVSYSLAAFPLLSRLYAEGKKALFVKEVIEPLSHILFWSVPVTVFFIVLRAQIVRTILGTGSFDWNDTRLTAAACALFVISVSAQNAALLLIRAHYAAGHTKRPFYQAVVAAIASYVLLGFGYIYLINDSFAWSFVESLFRVSDIEGTEVLLLPLAFSFGALLQALLLWRSFRKEYGEMINSMRQSLFQSLGASLIGGYAAYQALAVLDDVFNIETTFGIFSQGFLAGLVGIIVTAIILKALGNKEFEVVMNTLRSRIWKAKPLAEDVPEVV